MLLTAASAAALAVQRVKVLEKMHSGLQSLYREQMMGLTAEERRQVGVIVCILFLPQAVYAWLFHEACIIAGAGAQTGR